MKYITHKRFRGNTLSGRMNIPHGTKVNYDNGWLLTEDGKLICRATSENGYTYFHEDSPEGNLRYAMITALEKYYKADGDINDVYYREFEPQENDYWLHILRTMDTARLTALCFKRLGGIPCTK